MKIVSYPTQLGSMEGLNEKGQLLLKMSMLDALERKRLKKTSWRTFHDIDTTSFKSLHTATEAIPLKAHWLDIDDMDPHPHFSS
jgi:cell division FtsZ-interacting protein ZapD